MSEVSIGKVGVHLVCASLEAVGISASIVEQQGFDVVAVYKNKIYRIEVKATSRPIPPNNRYAYMTVSGGDKRMIDGSACDIVALVDNSDRRCYYMPAKNVRHRKTSIYNHDFTDEFLLFTNAAKEVDMERDNGLE